ncbi:hypothetical protein QYE76_027100 [Lolium multiflorum]|uniref:CCHC-type domain-containing protein n=1 Tax=Lolium multiflorum TaxID=4521 RepID=A0AAD8QG28_LOLMU|nr:hypothetical protein QYE76_027100 [Lolium multiflorum]
MASTGKTRDIQCRKCLGFGHIERECRTKRVMLVREDGEYDSASDFDEDTLALIAARDGANSDSEREMEVMEADTADQYRSLVAQRVLSVQLSKAEHDQRHNLFQTRGDEDIPTSLLPPSSPIEDEPAVKLKSNEVRIGPITRARAKLLKQQVSRGDKHRTRRRGAAGREDEREAGQGAGHEDISWTREGGAGGMRERRRRSPGRSSVRSDRPTRRTARLQHPVDRAPDRPTRSLKKPDDTPVTWREYEALRDHLSRELRVTTETFDTEIQGVNLKVDETTTAINTVQTSMTTLQASMNTLTQAVQDIRTMVQQQPQHPFDEDGSVNGDNADAAAAQGMGRGVGRGLPRGVNRGFVEIGARRVPLQQDDGLGKPKFSIPRFEGGTDVEEYLTWELKIERLWRLHPDYTEDKKIKLASSEFDGYALRWWDALVQNREEDGELAIVTWRTMKAAMRARFVPTNYLRSVFDKLTQLKQGVLTVDAYYMEMEMLMQRARVRESLEMTMQRFLNGLKFNIKGIVRHHKYATMNELLHHAREAESQLAEEAQQRGRATGAGRYTPRPPPSTAPSTRPTDVPSSSSKPVSNVSHTKKPVPAASGTGSSMSTARNRDMLCHTCGGKGHFKKDCPNRKVMIINEDNEYETGDDADPDAPEDDDYDSDSFDAYPSEAQTIVVSQRVLNVQPSASTQRCNLFQTKALVGPDKACKVIIDGGSCRNLASKELCAKLKLKYLPHPHPYYIQWLSNNGEMKVSHMVRVDFEIGPNLATCFRKRYPQDYHHCEKKPDDTPVTWREYEALRDHLSRELRVTTETFDTEIQGVNLKVDETTTAINTVQTSMTTLQASMNTLTQAVQDIRTMVQQQPQHPFDEDGSVNGDNADAAAAQGMGRGVGRGLPRGVNRGFVEIGARRVPLQQDDGLGKPKFSIPRFEGGTDVEEYLTWELKIERLWRLHPDYTEDKKIKLASSEFDGYALRWWDALVQNREEDGELAIVTWRTMKAAMRARFVPTNYLRSVFDKLTQLKQGVLTVDAYYMEMEMLMQRARVRESLEMTMQRFLNGLKFNIKGIVRHHKYATMNELLHHAREAESQLAEEAQQRGRATGAGRYTPRPPPSTAPSTRPTDVPSSSSKPVSNVSHTKKPVPAASGTGSSMSTARNRDMLCHTCGGKGHFKKDCPNRKVMIINEDNEYETGDDADPDAPEDDDYDSDSFDAYPSEAQTIVVSQRVLNVQPSASTQRCNLFQTKALVGPDKACKVIIDGGSCRNLASKELCAKLKLKYLPHPHPYYIQWLSNNGEMKVSHMVRVDFEIGPYKDSIDFDVVPMTVCHLLLGRPWLYDRSVQHNGRANTYHLEFKGKKINLQPMSPQQIVNESRQKIEVNLEDASIDRRENCNTVSVIGQRWPIFR